MNTFHVNNSNWLIFLVDAINSEDINTIRSLIFIAHLVIVHEPHCVADGTCRCHGWRDKLATHAANQFSKKTLNSSYPTERSWQNDHKVYRKILYSLGYAPVKSK